MSRLPEAMMSIEDALERDEGQLFDRKSIRIHARELAQHLIAFANADGGEIVVDVDNDKNVEGITAHESRVNQLLQSSIDFCTPPVRTSHFRIPCRNQRGQEDEILLLSIEQSDRVHLTTGGEAYLRIGDQSRRLSPEQYRQLLYDKGEQRYEDELVSEVAEENLDDPLLARFQSLIGVIGETERLLAARHLAKQERDTFKITRAGILLFHATPTLHFPRHGIRFIRYEGDVAATGIRQNITADRRYESPLPRLIEEAFDDIGNVLREFVRLNPRSSSFEREPEYPEFAWKEAIVNAVAHRAYTIHGQMIEVRLYNNRLEIESPGRLPGLVRIANIREAHFQRNPRIARVLNDFGFVQELGEGVDRMFQEMDSLGLPPPAFQEREGSLLVTLENDMTHRQMFRTPPTNIGAIWAVLPVEERHLLANLAAIHSMRGGRLTAREAERGIRRSRPTVIRYFNDLIQRGLVLRLATSPTDPLAFYVLADPTLADEIEALARHDFERGL